MTYECLAHIRTVAPESKCALRFDPDMGRTFEFL